MGLRKWLFAASYDRLTGPAEKWLAPYRQRTAGQTRGHTLEIAAGTGANLPFYPEEVSITIVEPNPHMARRLEHKARALGREVTVLPHAGESLPFPDATFDSVVTTLVLCSVQDLKASLRVVRRVIKPVGGFFFYKHVAAQGGWTLRFQNWIGPFWKFFWRWLSPAPRYRVGHSRSQIQPR
jgi:ubiquinone/menaquinone biosynthesis C-methylase UbiE